MKAQLNQAIVQGLLQHGLSKRMAETIAHRAAGSQLQEWQKVITRCKNGEVTRLYLFVTHFSELRFRTFIYAPGEVDNSKVIAAMLGTRAESGWVGGSATPSRQQAFPVSMFDIAREFCAAT